jgi:ATP-binding cassette, subfamily C, bacterial LapB
MTDKFGFDGLDYLTKSQRNDGEHVVHNHFDRLEKAFHAGGIPTTHNMSSAEACLRPALAAIRWDGVERHILEALPHFEALEKLEDLRAVLSRLHIQTDEFKTSLMSLTEDDLPCLFTVSGEDVMVIASSNPNGTLTVFEGASGESKTITPNGLPGRGYRLEYKSASHQKAEIARTGWVGFALGKFRPALMMILGISLLVNMASLALPFFVMSVYDMGISTKSKDVVAYLALGAMIVIGTDFALRLVRTKTMAYFAARFDAVLGMATFQQLINLPLHMTEGAQVGTQLNRLRQFEGVREAFTGTLAIAMVDVPYIFVFMIAIGIIAPKLVLIPLALLFVFTVLALLTTPSIRRNNAKSGELRSKTTNLAMELISKRGDYKDVNATDMALARFTVASEEQSRATLKAQQSSAFMRNFTSSLTAFAGLGTLVVGATLALDNVITIGALIATMALVWRVVSPLQQAFLSLVRIEQTIDSLKQINRMMAMQPERDPGSLPAFNRTFNGDIKANRIMFKFQTRHEATLKGVSLSASKGEIIGISGPSGSGKSTLMKALAGLYTAQQGSVLVDGIDMRQLDPAEFRGSIGFVTDQPAFFYGTVEQNMKLGFPQATDNDVREALRDAGVAENVNALPNGMMTRLTGGVLKSISEPFKQKLNIARAYTRKAPLYLMDNPTNNLDNQGLKLLCTQLDKLRGNSTVIFTSQNKDLLMKADKMIWLVNGMVALEGTPDEVYAKINQSMAA